MKVEIKVPPLGESVSEATIANFIKPNGSIVKTDEEIIELETEKVNQVLYAPESGQISWQVTQGETVKVGQSLGYVDTDVKGEAAKQEAPKQQPKQEPQKEAPAPQPSGETSRKMAKEFISEMKEPSQERPTPSQRMEAPKPSAPMQPTGAVTRKKMSALRKTIASRLVEVKNTTAMLTTFNEIDMSAVMAIRASEKDNFLKKYDVKLGFMSFFVKAVVAALKAYPQVNASIDGDDMVLYNTYDIGIAVSTEKGLMVPVIRNSDKLTFGGIEQAINEYAKKARDGKISIDDLRGGSFTITNGGTFGSLLSTPILNPPQSAILGMHAIVKRPVAINDKVEIRPMMYVALSYDHRIIDGKEAVLFLVHLKENLEDPARLLLDL